jgi:hypothetical protein
MDSAIKNSKKISKSFRHHVFKGSKKVSKGTVKGLNKVRKAIGLKNMKRMGKGIKKFWHKAF